LLVNRSHNIPINLATADGLHHGKMLEIVVRLKEGIAGEEFDEDASYTPDIARETPAQVKDNLRCSVVTSRDYWGVVFVIEGCWSKVDQADLGIKKNLAMPRRPVHSCWRWWYSSIVRKSLVIVVDKQDVLRFQIGVDEVEVVKEGNAGKELFSELLDVRAGEWDKAVGLEKVKHALAIEVGDNADMVPEVEAIS
jgi:hypothetical protein